jgi:GH24 family phage-related lysozyme (muramidase)
LAEGLSLQVKSELDFDPSIRNIVKIFTTAAEVFMYCIYEVSKNASSDTNDVRRDELAKVFKNKVNSSDINTDATTNNGVNNLIPKYYPWPDYRKEKDKVLEDAYLGEPGVLDNPDNVPELFFIRDLLKAFIEQAQTQNDMDRLAESLKSNWVPSNPLDTRVLGNNLAPYSRINPKTQNELLVLTLTRAATFLGITNNETTLTSDEIIAMANFEAQAVMNDSPNKSTVVQSLSQLVSGATNVIKTTKGVINSNDSFVFVEENNAYTYRYILPENTNKYFPINDSFNEAEWPNNFTQLKEKQESGSLFLGNRYFYEKPTNPTNPADDGATYLRIVDKDSYVNGAANYSLPTGLNTESIINLTKLKDIEGNIDSVGFNCFGGLYGIQEFSTLDWGDEALDGLPLSTLFYSDSLDSGEGNFANGLAYFRSVSNQTNQSQPTTSVFDVKPNKYKVDYNIDSITDMLIEPAKMLHKDYGKTIDLMSKVKKGEQNISYPYIHFNVFDEEGSDTTRPISLFGSNLYYGQTKEESKAFLFLHTLPWNGLLSKNYAFGGELKTNTIFTAIDNLAFTDVDTEILNLFKYRAGFVYAPTLWVAFIGGLLWRYEETSDPIVFFDGTNSLLPTFGTNSPTSHPDRYPKKDEYLTVNEFQFDIQVIDTRRDFPIVPMSFINDGMLAGTGYKYRKIDEVLLKLPKQAKEEFKNFFLDFTKSDDWDAIKSELELKTQGTWAQAYQTATSSNGGVLTQTGSEFFLNTNSMKQLYGDNFDNYIIFKPYLGNSNYSKNYFLEIKDDSDVRNTLISVLQKEVVISNMSYRIWDKQNLPANQNNVSNVVISKENAELYMQTFLKNFEGMEPITEEQQKKQIKNSIFGTSDDNLIKFMLYRTCKNMYDKWIAETEDGDNIFFQCGGRNITDSALAKKRTNSNSANPRLIDSFRFVSRSFEDIGDRFAVNPFPIHDIMKTQPNTSLYDMVTSILSSNNFDFIALPSFINYRNLETVKSVFTPYPTYSDSDVSGPSFICMYVGQTSKHLDFKGSNYPNDGFDVRDGDIPTDFTNTMNDYEDPTVFFKVRFGQQNQNIFKDIVLDQSEFAETAESLQIMDDISKKGAETYRTLAGQNIYNVYSVRSYKVEVEMMGNAMIQPMMYFQLDNIPMFHGAYVITRVKHSIKPNHMTTNFTGSRIRKSVTPIFEAGDLYMSLIDTINAANVNPSEPTRPLGSRILSLSPVVNTLYQTRSNNGDDSNQTQEANKVIPVGDLPNGIRYSSSELEVRKRKLIPQAIPALKRMLTDWVNWMKINTPNIADTNGTYATITSMYRTYEDQQKLYAEYKAKGKVKQVAEPGSSPHGWGVAIDFQFQKSGGDFIANNSSNLAEGFDYSKNVSLKWLAENSYKYGWIIPIGLRDGSNLDEFWHFEYHGTATKCLLQKNPIYRGPRGTSDGITVRPTENYVEGIVKNPIASDGKEAVYLENDCDYKTVKRGDGTGGITSTAYPNIKPTDSQIAMIDSLSGTWDKRATTFIKKFEGFTEIPKLDAGTYRGGYGTDNIVYTIGGAATKVTQSTRFTQETAEITLQYDINNRFKPAVISVLGQTNWNKLNDNQKAAIISYSYNAGAGTLKTRGIVDAITNNNYKSASQAIFDGPITSNEKVLDGLIRRRKSESILFDKSV